MRWKISLSHHKMGVIQFQYQNDLQVTQNSLKGCLLKKTLPTPQQRGFLGSQKSYIVFDHKFHFKALKDQRFMKPSRLSTVQTNTFLSLSTLTNIKSFDRNSNNTNNQQPGISISFSTKIEAFDCNFYN